MRFRILSSILFLVVAAVMVAEVRGQFDDEVAAEAPASSDSQPQRDELVLQLESTAARGGQFRALAIRSLARVGAWPQVDRWLSSIDAVADPSELAQSAETIGSPVLLRISLRPELSDGSRSAIKKMIAAAEARNQAVDRLQEAIRQLATGDVDANLAAIRVLIAGGDAAIQEIVSAIAKGLPTDHRDKLLRVLKSLGQDGTRSLDQLSLYGDPGVRPATLEALQLIDPQYALGTLISAALGSDATSQEVQIARGSGAIPEDFQTVDAIAVLADRLSTLRKEAFRAPNDQTPATLWSVDANLTGVVPNRSTEIFLRYRDAYDAAQRLRRIGNLPPGVGRLVFSTDLSYRVMVDVDWGDPEQLEQIRSLYPEWVNPKDLLEALSEARADEDVPAAVGILRLIADSISSGFGSDSLLVSGGTQFSELVQAVRDPDARIRYEAAACVAELTQSLASTLPFAGASYVRRTLAEMASLDSRPTAILLENRPVVALRQETILTQLGYAVRKVTSAVDAEREIQSGGDLRLLVSKITIADSVPSELVDRVRRQPKGGRLPIVFYSDAETSERSIRQAEFETTSSRWVSENTPAVYLVALPGSTAALADVLAEAKSKRRLEPLSVGDRAHFRVIGVDALQGNSLPR